MEKQLKNQELHEFAQWFAFNYGGGKGGEEVDNKYPREDIIELVDEFIKNKSTNVGFVKWFAEKYEIYGDCKGRSYQDYSEDTNWDLTMHKAKTSQEWIDFHFKGSQVTNGLLYDYFQSKIKGKLFELTTMDEFLKEASSEGIKVVNNKGESLND